MNKSPDRIFLTKVDHRQEANWVEEDYALVLDRQEEKDIEYIRFDLHRSHVDELLTIFRELVAKNNIYTTPFLKLAAFRIRQGIKKGKHINFAVELERLADIIELVLKGKYNA